MAKGDQEDFTSRTIALVPGDWLGDTKTIWRAVLAGIGHAAAFVYDLIGYTRLQTRINTATDGWLDLIAFDFFGLMIQRGPNQSDASFRNTIVVNLFRERATRKAVNDVVAQVTGFTPIIFEPSRMADTGCYGGSMMGYGVAGAYGCRRLPFQAFITACRPLAEGIPYVAGYGVSTGGYGQPSRAEYAGRDQVINGTLDADIYAAIDSVKPAATIMWTRIVNTPGPQPIFFDESHFTIDGIPIVFY